MIKLFSYFILVVSLFLVKSANAATVPVHDPSIVIVYKDANGNSYPSNDAAASRTKYYYIFGTQVGAAYSKDMINWTAFTPTFSINGTITNNYYQLVTSEADYAGHTTSADVKGNLWAPDVIYNKALGKWTMYFSLSGNEFKSSIILFTASKIEGPYERVGSVVHGGFTNSTTSIARTDYAKVIGTSTVDGRYLDNSGKWDNTYAVSCIDPAVLYDESGKLWMVYGSWSGGIFLLKLNEQTGLRDYSYNYGLGSSPVWNGGRLRFDPYMGIHIGGGYYVSGEGSYIRYIKDANGVGYYYLFISMGFYSPEGGYTMRVFRSSTIDGQYTDVTGDNAVFDKYIFNYGNNTQYGMPIMQNYKYNWWTMADVAQGHNSVLRDEDGSAYLVYHTKFDNGTAWHNVEVHQLFFNENGWPLAAPFEYRVGFGLSKKQHNREEITGIYSVITHNSVDYAKLKSNLEEEMYVNADGTLTGAYTGTWSYNFSSGKHYITLTTSAGTFKGAMCEQLMDGLSTRTVAFTAMNSANERCLWGYKRTNTATINTTNYKGESLLIGDRQYSLTWDAYTKFNKQSVNGDFEVEYLFDNYTQAAENWHNWAVAVKTTSETWHLRADAWSVGTFTGSTVNHSYTWDWTQFKDVYKNKKVRLKVSRVGTNINVFSYVDSVLVYSCTSANSPVGAVDVYLGGETCYLDVKKISIVQLGVREVVGTTNDDGTYTVPFNSVKGNTISVSGDFELIYKFNNYHNPISVDNWDNYILRAISGSSTMLLRADSYAMDVFGSLAYTYDWNWANFASIMTGANVEFKITRNGSIIIYKATITARDGKLYNYQVIQTGAPTTTMSFGFTGEESLQDFFVVEKISNEGSDVVTGQKQVQNTLDSTNVYSYEKVLYINALESGEVEIYNVEGKSFGRIKYNKGMNQIFGLAEGLYLIGGSKIVIF
ncbi:MAG: glycoside hydrolase family 43 protein [Sporocytophaga sp.]|uniref:glycoside hydrolase family 43 protein n=1 Tax=Sporocytophaga sp. TaxID=2231183 RepID=UPI001B19BEBA|nr:glycoside hydrolase family 43 protein [Sporocytophaga sp.]MBO9701129.1 glycoside hydrolase family 43 protein [Sporocytophaga sp.]